jgi:glycosyltransferase involved in cell wall biosynthesis
MARVSRRLKVSVVVPVHNPGADIDDCVRSLLDQTLHPDEYEVVFVDDGSTDATPARLDELAARDDRVTVEHIPSSGWPGRPRNLGTDRARGEYVYYVDHDDWISHDALERLYKTARRDNADIVVGKVVGHGKRVPRGVFESGGRQVGLESIALLGLLTPHKLFRRGFLAEHAIRFPEGPRRLEDHVFVMRAFLSQPRISVIADRPVYHWIQHDHAENASMRPFDPAGYYGNLREVLDVVLAQTEPGEFRDELLTHWYRGKMLGRLGGRNFARRSPEVRRELFEEVRALALERYGPWVEERLAFNMRLRSRLLSAGDLGALEALAEREARLRARARACDVRADGRGLVIRIDGRLRGREDGPLLFHRDGERLIWSAPAAVAATLTPEQLDAAADLGAGTVQVFLRSTADPVEYLVPNRSRVRFAATDREPAAAKAILDVDARVQARHGAAGSRLPAGEWELHVVVAIAGFQATTHVRRPGSSDPLVLTCTRAGRIRATAVPV